MSRGYNNNPNLPREDWKHAFTQQEIDEFIKCANDPVYFACTYMKIVNVDRGLMPFEMWDFQQDMLKSFHENRFSICKLPRQVGKCFELNTVIKIRENGIVSDITVGELYARFDREATESPRLQNKEARREVQRQDRRQGLCEMPLLWSDGGRLDLSRSDSRNDGSGIYQTFSTEITDVSGRPIEKDFRRTESGISTWWQILSIFREILQSRSQYSRKQRQSEKKQTRKKRRQHKDRILAQEDQWRFRRSEETSFFETINFFFREMYKEVWRREGQRGLVQSTRTMDEEFQKAKLFKNISSLVQIDYGNVSVGDGLLCGVGTFGYDGIQKQRVQTETEQRQEYFDRLHRSEQKEDYRVRWNILAQQISNYTTERNRQTDYVGRERVLADESERRRLQAKSERYRANVSRLSDTIERKFVDCIELDEIEVFTDSGWKSATHLYKTVEYDEWILETESHRLVCADDHIAFRSDGTEVFVKNLKIDDEVLTENGVERVVSVIKTDKKSHMFDLTVDSDDHRFYTNGILSHNTTTSVAFLLHFILFNENVNVAILANKSSTAREIMGRLQLAFEYLPRFLQQGVKEWNKGSLEFSNGSRAVADSTSGSSVRGRSFNVIFLDEFAFVPNNIAEAFFMSTYPTISSGNTTKVIIVSTPNGLNLFYRMWTEAIEKRSLYIPIEIHWSMVPGRTEEWKEQTIRNTSPDQFRQEFECVSGKTLVNVRNKETGKEETLTIEELYERM